MGTEAKAYTLNCYFTLMFLVWSSHVHLLEGAKEFSLARYGVTFANNSVIDRQIIGEGYPGVPQTDSGALECHTDDTTCCRGIDNPNGGGRGEWYFPDGTVVPPPGDDEFYRTRDHMVIRLNRGGTLSPTGIYHCDIPGAGGIIITRYIQLGTELTCDDLPVMNNPEVSYTPPLSSSANGVQYTGTIATYICLSGYQLVGGSSLRACGADGEWNGTAPSCETIVTTTTGTSAPTDPPTTAMTSVSTNTGTSGPTDPPTTAMTIVTTSTGSSVPTDPPTTTMTIVSTTTGTSGPTEPPTTTMATDHDQSTSQVVTPTDPPIIDNNTATGSPIDTGAVAGGIGAAIVVAIFLVVGIILVVVFTRRNKGGKHTDTDSSGTQLKELPPLSNPIPSSLTNKDEEKTITSIKDQLTVPSIIEFPMDTTSVEGEEVYLHVQVKGHPTPSLKWYHDSVVVRADYSREIDGDGGLLFPCIEVAHSGEYKLVATNSSGNAESEVTLTVLSDSCDGDEDDGSSEINGPVPVDEFGGFVADKHANGNKKFRDDYQGLDSGEKRHKITVALTRDNKLCNRFKNITVYDDNRILLQPMANSPSDYINASYIDGYSSPKKFIGTQGPLPCTVIDFWRMVWQEKSTAIVMLTNVEESNKIKCEQYWPGSGKKIYGPFLVIITDQQILADYVVRTFVISDSTNTKSKTLKLTQFHFTAWPDHGVPDYATPILAFHRRVKAHYVSSRGPLIVHCSAGVGRTGTYIVLDNVLDQIEAEGVVDIDGAIVKARNQRMKLVQTKDQYIFIHDAILEVLTCGDTQITATNLRLQMDKLSREDPTHKCTVYQHQFNVLDQVTPSPTEVNCSTALNNPNKNRGDKYLPVESSRVILKGEQPDYIHAVLANGYKHQKAYIIAQNPLKSTVRNFWKVIYDRKCAVVVMLSRLKEKEKEACAKYWPGEGSIVFGEFTVDFIGEEEYPGFILRKLTVNSFKSQHSHQVTQFHVTNWSPDGTCSNLKVITDVIEEVAKVQRRTGNNPILVHCSDTVSRSGMFCAIATTIDRCKTEGVVDVFQVVKALRIHKPGAVLTVEQYQFVHEAILVFLDSFDTYSNFQMV